MNEKETRLLPEGLTHWMAPVLGAAKSKVLALCLSVAAVGLALLLLTKPVPPAPAQTAQDQKTGSEEAGDRTAQELAEILSRIAGAGRVEVRLTFAASAGRDWEQNRRHTRRTVEDRGEDGSVQITSEETDETTLALVRRSDGGEAPVEKGSYPARVAGAIVVADGAADPRVGAELARAAAAFLQIGLHRVLVYPREVTE